MECALWDILLFKGLATASIQKMDILKSFKKLVLIWNYGRFQNSVLKIAISIINEDIIIQIWNNLYLI